MAKRGRKPGGKLKLTPNAAKTRAKALALRGEGLTFADVAARCGVVATTVLRWERAAVSEPGPAAVAAARDDLEAEPASEILVEGVDEAELTTQIRDVAEMIRSAKTSGSVMDFVRLSKLHAELVVARSRSRPPTPPDPESDPANATARDLVRAMLRRTVERVEARVT